jgi:hypothetical protein
VPRGLRDGSLRPYSRISRPYIKNKYLVELLRGTVLLRTLIAVVVFDNIITDTGMGRNFNS